MEIKQAQRHRRLVLVPCPFQGHINPMLQLGTILHSKGFSITIAHTQFNSPNPATHPHFTFLPIPDGLSDNDIASGNVIGLVTNVNVNCEVPLREILAQMREREEKHDDEIACIIYDGFMHFSEAVANDLKIPSIVFRTFSVGTGLAHTAFPRLQAEGYIPLKDSKSEDPIPGLHPLRLKDLPISHFAKLEVLLALIANSYNMRSSSAMIWNTLDFLEQPVLADLQQHYQIPFFSVGPLYKIAPAALSSSLLKEDNSCITWLDKQTKNSVIYISIGSIASLDKNELAKMAWGLANSKQPFLWVIRPGSIHDSEWIEQLPEGFEETVGERGCIVKWAPQIEVLAHVAVGGFWSHCGWNSTLESICEGVPMICQPFFGDQRVNARYLSLVWKVGLVLENELESEEIERAVKRLMVDKEGEEMRQRAMDLKVKAELCIKEGGSSYKSLNDLVEFILSFG